MTLDPGRPGAGPGPATRPGVASAPATRAAAARSERPALLLFDGDCGLCAAAAGRARDHDRHSRFRIEPHQNWSDAELAAAGLTRALCAGALQVVSAGGRRYPGALGVNYFLWRCGGAGRLVLVGWLLPPLILLEMLVYALVAWNRRRLSRWLGLAACAPCPRGAGGER